MRQREWPHKGSGHKKGVVTHESGRERGVVAKGCNNAKGVHGVGI